MPNKKQGDSEGIEKILKDPKFAGKFIMKNMLPKKMSEVILDFAKPLLDKTDLTNKVAAEKAIQLAIEIWNYTISIEKLCIIDGQKDNKIYKLAMIGVAKNNLSYKISRNDYLKLVNRKETLYPENNFFIIEHNLRWSDNGEQMHLAVITGDADKANL